MRLVLASGSPRRRELLARLGLEFDVAVSGELESETERLGADPVRAAGLASQAKALAVAGMRPEDVVLGADTIVVLDEKILNKPASPADAHRMLQSLSGRRHRVITAVAVVGGGRRETGHAATDVWFRELTSSEIEWYVRSGEPMDKAGAYGIQGLGAALVERIEGCYSNVVGLPLALTLRLLERFGIRALGRCHDSGPLPGPRGGLQHESQTDVEATADAGQTPRATD